MHQVNSLNEGHVVTLAYVNSPCFLILSKIKYQLLCSADSVLENVALCYLCRHCCAYSPPGLPLQTHWTVWSSHVPCCVSDSRLSSVLRVKTYLGGCAIVHKKCWLPKLVGVEYMKKTFCRACGLNKHTRMIERVDECSLVFLSKCPDMLRNVCWVNKWMSET